MTSFMDAPSPNIRVCVHKDFHVQGFHDLGVMEGQDPLEDQDVGPVHGDGLGLPAVGHKVVDGHLNLQQQINAMVPKCVKPY